MACGASLEFSRRVLFQRSAAAAMLAGTVTWLNAEDRPPATNPRATSGDEVSEPKWAERLTITVGPENADLVGKNEKVIQAAVDYLTRLGGGTVKILPGKYQFRNAVYLSSKIRIVGSGADSIITKEASVTSKLAADSDWYDQEITLVDSKGFSVGDGVCFRAKNPHDGGRTVIKRTLVARDGNRFKLDRALRENLWLMSESTASSLFPLFSGEQITDVVIENVTLDGNRSNNANLDGNYAGCIFLQDCSRITMRDVTARNYNGDGMSWQICHDVIVERCHSHDHAGLGLHPGSGSQRPLIRNNRLERNDIGLFFCWGVKYGLAEGNQLQSNRVGISIGHRDTDNLIRDNRVQASRDVGVLFRPERGKDFAPHRNRLENNQLFDNGGEKAAAIDVQGEVEAVAIQNNEIRESRAPMQRAGIRIGEKTRNIRLVENRIEGFAVAVDDRRGS